MNNLHILLSFDSMQCQLRGDMKNDIKKLIARSLQSSFPSLKESPEIQITVPKDKAHGDYSSNIAVVLCRLLKSNPKELAETIADVVGFSGDIKWDTSKPNGTPRKVLNVDKMKSFGWEPKIGFREGIQSTYEWYKENGIQLAIDEGQYNSVRPIASGKICINY